MNQNVMNFQDAPNKKLAEAFVTIENNRYNIFSAKEFDAHDSVTNEDVKVIGNLRTGHKAVEVDGSFSLTIYHVTPIFEKLIKTFEETGIMPTFDIQVSSYDPATAIGTDTKIYSGCQIDGDIALSDFSSDGGFREQEISGFYNSWKSASEYKNPVGM